MTTTLPLRSRALQQYQCPTLDKIALLFLFVLYVLYNFIIFSLFTPCADLNLNFNKLQSKLNNEQIKVNCHTCLATVSALLIRTILCGYVSLQIAVFIKQRKFFNMRQGLNLISKKQKFAAVHTLTA